MAFVPGFLLPLLTLGCSLCLYKASVAFSRSHLLLSPFIDSWLIPHIDFNILHASVFLFTSSPYHVTSSESYNKVQCCFWPRAVCAPMTGSFLNPGVLIYLTCLPGLLPVPTFTGWVFSKQRWEFWVETVASQRRGNWRLTLECRFEIT